MAVKSNSRTMLKIISPQRFAQQFFKMQVEMISKSDLVFKSISKTTSKTTISKAISKTTLIMIDAITSTRFFKSKFTNCKLLPRRTEDAKVSGGPAATPWPQERASQRVEHYAGSGSIEVVDAVTCAGDAGRLAICSGSLSSSGSMLAA